MPWHDTWKSDGQLERERRELRYDWPYPSYEREQEAEDRIREIDYELRQREDRREEEAAAERAAERARWEQQAAEQAAYEEAMYQQWCAEQQAAQEPEPGPDNVTDAVQGT